VTVSKLGIEQIWQTIWIWCCWPR